MDSTTQSAVTHTADERGRLARELGGPKPCLILVVTHGSEVRVVPLANEAEVVVGRGEAADVRVGDDRLSRAHARFRCAGSTVQVTDLGSRNGTYVRRQSVQHAALRAGDVALLGSVMVSVQLVGSARGAGEESVVPKGAAAGESAGPAVMVGSSPAMLELQRMVERMARKAVPVLILGETGTGKELVARGLHELGPRSAAPFKVINCAAIPANLVESVLFGHRKGAFTGAIDDRAGVFEQARGGTVFLDEIGELSPGAQAALLRVVESKRFCPVGGAREITADVRFVAATHRDLAAMAEQGSFRLDLIHRLNTVTLEAPALRARREDVPALAQHFLERCAAQSGERAPSITPDALACLESYSWPGNVRELRNVVERAVALCDGDVIGREDLPAHVVQSASELREYDHAPADEPHARSLRSDVHAYEADLIHDALRRAGGNRRAAAALLNLPLRTFERRLAKLRA